MDAIEKERLTDQLYRLLAGIRTPEDMARLLEDLCTYTEVEQMAQRVECARLLAEGNTYSRIMAKTEISSATLSRVSRCLQHGSGGYRELMPAVLNDRNT